MHKIIKLKTLKLIDNQISEIINYSQETIIKCMQFCFYIVQAWW